MRHAVKIAGVFLLFMIPFVSLAELRYVFDNLVYNFDLRLLILPLLLLIIFALFIYSVGKEINDELDEKYKLIGTKGGKSKRG